MPAVFVLKEICDAEQDANDLQSKLAAIKIKITSLQNLREKYGGDTTEFEQVRQQIDELFNELSDLLKKFPSLVRDAAALIQDSDE